MIKDFSYFGLTLKFHVIDDISMMCKMHVISTWSFYLIKCYQMSQPYFWNSGRMIITLPKWELGTSPGLPKLQSLISGVKTPHIEVTTAMGSIILVLAIKGLLLMPIFFIHEFTCHTPFRVSQKPFGLHNISFGTWMRIT